jgi:NADH dehydrogenase
MRIAVLGAGYAGLTAARRLERLLPDAEVVVVDESADHLVQHELHRVVRRPNVAEDITVPLTEVLGRAETQQVRVEGVDVHAGVAHLDDGTLAYDWGVLALGARTAFYDLPGVEEHAVPLKRLDDAWEIREAFLGGGDSPRAVVGGAGLSGVQVAGELTALAEEEGLDATVTLVERLDEVAPNFDPAFQTAVREELEKRDVEVRTGVAVERATAESVTLVNGTELPYDTFVWTGGLRGSDPAPDRPVVRADLRLGERTFGVGDAVRVVDADGQAVPASAAAAIRSAPVAATNVARLVRHEASSDGGFPPRLDRYDTDVPGWVVSVGDGAVAQVGPTVLRGQAARAAKATVGGAYLGSLGAVTNASDLVREELGLGADD